MRTKARWIGRVALAHERMSGYQFGVKMAMHSMWCVIGKASKA